MNDTDIRIIAALRSDARRSISDIAAEIGVSRATVRTRMEKLIESGEILGFSVELKSDRIDMPIRAMTSIEVEGKRTDDVVRRLSGLPEVRTIHSTNGRWDLIAEVATKDLEAFDEVLRRIRLIEGITVSESNLLLSTRKKARIR